MTRLHNYTDINSSDYAYVGNSLYGSPSGRACILRLKTGWDLVDPNAFAYFFFREQRQTFIGNHHGVFSVTIDRNSFSIISERLFRVYFNDPNCPYACAMRLNPYQPSISNFKIVLKPIHDLWFCETQLFFENMDATERRNAANEHTEKALSIARAESLVRASTPSIEKIKSGLQAPDRVMYTQVKSEILDLIAEGKIQPLSNLEIERITLMRMVEFKGLIDVLNTDTHATTDGEDGLAAAYTKEAVAMMNLMRQIGNEAQRMTDGASTTKKNGKSAFAALEEMVKAGNLKIEITKADEKLPPIDADYKVLLDEKRE